MAHMMRNRFTKEKFMSEVQKYPVLYDKFSKDFMNLEMKKNAWSNIVKVFELTA